MSLLVVKREKKSGERRSGGAEGRIAYAQYCIRRIWLSSFLLPLFFRTPTPEFMVKLVIFDTLKRVIKPAQHGKNNQKREKILLPSCLLPPAFCLGALLLPTKNSL